MKDDRGRDPAESAAAGFSRSGPARPDTSRPEEMRRVLDGFQRRGVGDAAAPAEGRPVRSAVAIAVTMRGDEPGIWLTRRSFALRSHPGQFALPGGRVDPGEDECAAARRELEEELGVVVGERDVLGVLDDYTTRSGYTMTPVVLWAGADRPVTPNPGEVAEVFFVPFEEVDVEPLFDRIPQSDRPVVKLPWRGGHLHAPTAAVIYQFREVVLHGKHTRVADLEQPVFAWR